MERLSKIIINFNQYNISEKFCHYLLTVRIVISEIPVSAGIFPFCINCKTLSESDKALSRPGIVAVLYFEIVMATVFSFSEVYRVTV
jgi:hypothetical protein